MHRRRARLVQVRRVRRGEEEVLHGAGARAHGQRPPAGLDAQRGGVLVVGGHGPGAPAAAAAQHAGDGRTLEAPDRAGRSPSETMPAAHGPIIPDGAGTAHIIAIDGNGGCAVPERVRPARGCRRSRAPALQGRRAPPGRTQRSPPRRTDPSRWTYAVIPTMGWLSTMEPVEPRKGGPFGGREGEDPAVGAAQVVAAGHRGHAHDRLVELDRARGAVEGRTVGRRVAEDAAVGGDQVVAAGERRGHADDRLVERQGARRAQEGGVAVVEDATVGCDEVVALAVGGGRHADDRLVELDAARSSRRTGRRRRRRSAVGGDEPVARPVRRHRHADDGRVEVQGAGRAVELGLPKLKMPPSEATR